MLRKASAGASARQKAVSWASNFVTVSKTLIAEVL